MNTRLRHTMIFTAGVYYEGKLLMNEYTVTVYMLTNTPDSTLSNVALNRMKYFIYEEIENTIFINSDNVDFCQKLAGLGLNITTLPSEPSEQIIGIMLYSKFNAITEGNILIGEVEISSSLGENIVYLHGDNETVQGFEEPAWWSSADLVHCEQDLIEPEKTVTLIRNSVWRDLNLHWYDEDSETTTQSGNTVVFADFRNLHDKE